VNTLLLLLACAIFMIAFVDYNKGVLAGDVTPVFPPWAIFSVVTSVNVATNLGLLAKGNGLDVALFATDFIVCVGTMIFILIRLNWKVSLSRDDKGIILLSAIAIVLWIIFRSATVGVLLNQIAYSLAWIPLYKNVWKEPKNEPTRAWSVFAFAFMLNIVALEIQPTTKMMDYVTPVVCLFHHAAIAGLSCRRVPASINR
jgi:hypothetical protein